MSDSHPRPIDPDTIDNAYDPDARMGEPYRAERMMAPAPVHHGISARPEAHHNQMEDGFCDEDNIDLYHDDNIDPARDDNVYHDEEDDFDPTRDYEEEASKQANGEPEEPRRREFKYSTASMPKRSRCRKWCLIFLLFLLFFAITTGISMLIDWLFFSDESDNAPFYPERDGNETFPQDKVFIDQVCSEGTTDFDGGARCREACQPQFLECCDPFNEFETHDYTESFLNATNTTLPPEEVYDDDLFKERVDTCTFDTNVRGCMAYGKCQVLGELVDAAPSTLPILCSAHYLEQDRTSCEQLCQSVRCCFSETNKCLATNFDVCMDYAPCQNLRSGFIVETAPDDLDKACFWELPECFETCEKAECCGNPDSSCYNNNFLSCLTYAPCTNVTLTKVEVPPIYSRLEKPPAEFVYACNEEKVDVHDVVEKTCVEYCEPAMCCYNQNPTENCFRDDPLGCMAWDQECQVIFELQEDQP